MTYECLDWPRIPIGPGARVFRILLRAPKETEQERWRRTVNAWVPSAMDTRGKHRPADAR